MSLYEIESMVIELDKAGKPEAASAEQMAAQKDWIANMFRNDLSVRLK